MKSLTKLLSIFFMIPQAFAIVDYSTAPEPQQNRFNTPHSIVRKRMSPMKRTNSNAASREKMLDFGLKYESLDVKSQDASGKVSNISFEGHIQTRNNIFLDFSYWQGQSATTSLSEDNSYQKGNPRLTIGLNWLKVGSGPDAAQIDLYTGVSLAEKKSYFATSRTDKIVGIETNKRIDDFAVGIGFEYIITGNAKNDEEIAIGNIRKITVGLGWMASADIRFALEASMTTVSSSSNEEAISSLDEQVSFSALSPKLYLLVSPHYDLEIGAIIRTREARSNKELTQAKIYRQEGAYGSSIYAGINFGI